MSLKQRLIEQITLEGPMTVADYMQHCLFDPQDGYYSTRPAIGADGDFITAPVISQMFGEMIGVWVAQVWQNMGSPEAFHLVEIGGGDGTLMSDVLRVAAQVPGLKAAAKVVMIEPSLPFRALQQEQVLDAAFVPDLDALSDELPIILVANEMLDCLPARQFTRIKGALHERVVGLDEKGDLCFGLTPVEEFMPHDPFPDGAIKEYSTALQRFAVKLSHKLKATTGAALLIDYGRDEKGTGDSLQALYRHEKRDPLDAPGEHDLTVWADFPAFAWIAYYAYLGLSKIAKQRDFLRMLGIDARVEALAARNPDHADMLQRQYDRLISPDQMGDLFKVLAIAYPASLSLPGLESRTPRGIK